MLFLGGQGFTYQRIFPPKASQSFLLFLSTEFSHFMSGRSSAPDAAPGRPRSRPAPEPRDGRRRAHGRGRRGGCGGRARRRGCGGGARRRAAARAACSGDGGKEFAPAAAIAGLAGAHGTSETSQTPGVTSGGAAHLFKALEQRPRAFPRPESSPASMKRQKSSRRLGS